jgi:hypothetical protein
MKLAKINTFLPMLGIRNGFNTDMDPAYYLNANRNQGAKPMRIHLDPDSK